MKKYGKLILKIVVSSALLTVILLKVDRASLIKNISLMDFRWAPVIVLCIILNYVFSSLRWKKLLVFPNTSHVTSKYLINLYFVGSFFNNFMPTSIGGDVYKVYKLGKKIDSTVNAFSATFVDRFTGIIALALIGVFGLFKYIGYYTIGVFALFFVGAFVGLKVLEIINKKFDIKLFKDIYISLMAYKDSKSIFGYIVITSFIVQFLSIFTQYFIFKSIGINVPLLFSFIAFPVVTIAGFVIPSLNGIGVQDALYMQFFGSIGISTEIALSASVLYHLFRLGISLIGGLLYAAGADE